MKKTLLAISIATFAMGSQAASMDDISISGFGSVGVGKSNNDVGYARYDSERFDTKIDSVAGIQFEFDINDRAKFVTQVVANGRYDFELEMEVAYLSYEFDELTARAGKLRTPFFFYSDYLDVGYAYPMIRPSQETYENVIVSDYIGGEIIKEIEFEDSTLVLQPFAGISQVYERDSTWGHVDLNKMFGLSGQYLVNDWVFRGSAVTTQTSYDEPSDPTSIGLPVSGYATSILDEKDTLFFAIGAQYDNGDLIAVIEATDVQMEGRYSDVRSASGLVGYRVNEFTPYLSVGWSTTTDDDERAQSQSPGDPTYDALWKAEQALNNYELISYSIGTRWDLARNIAIKADVTYVDYQNTSGGFTDNLDSSSGNVEIIEDSSIVYSATIDFVF